MTHTFLMEPGIWLLQGSWLERNGNPIPVKGKILINWSRDEWFTMVMRLVFPESERANIDFQYRGRFDMGDRRYTFVLQHSDLGRVEGEGWIAPESIIQRYWALGDKQRRSGFETLYRIADQRYYLSSGIMAGHYLTSALEATVERQVS
ncbi:MAG: hypothetical protein VKJ24_18480 [Synechococcales bacterium]|nr:hypothetical protein [Synechococcales bacterium]